MVSIATRASRLLQPERGQFLGRVRQQVDADPDRPDFGGRFENAAGNAGRVQRQPERQSADAGPDDDDVVHVSFRQRFIEAIAGMKHD